MEFDDNFCTNCYICGTAVHFSDAVVMLGNVYHSSCVETLPKDPKWPKKDLDDFVRDPETSRRAIACGLARLSGGGDRTYMVTYTTRPGCDMEKWKKRLVFEMQRKYVAKFELCIEHEDTNAHAHVLLSTTKYIKPRHTFKTYIKTYGNVDCRKVRYDNGISGYLEKEGTVYSAVEGGKFVE